MNIKAIKTTVQESSFSVEAVAVAGENTETISMLGNVITPRGVMVHCSGEKISALHNIEDDGCQSKYQSLLVELRLNFKTGEIIQLETSAQIQSIRRISQTDFEVSMGFCEMVQDGYRHISRYIEDLTDTE